jgi:hypothetical protein
MSSPTPWGREAAHVRAADDPWQVQLCVAVKAAGVGDNLARLPA